MYWVDACLSCSLHALLVSCVSHTRMYIGVATHLHKQTLSRHHTQRVSKNKNDFPSVYVWQDMQVPGVDQLQQLDEELDGAWMVCWGWGLMCGAMCGCLHVCV